MSLIEISRKLREDVAGLTFSEPVVHTYNPLDYAWKAHCQYLETYGQRGEREVLLFGMNPGPWGMAQTGIPFGDVGMVRDWLHIDAPITTPLVQHPKRPILGWNCVRTEVSGQRIWGWAKNTFGTADHFFSQFFIANYCPLSFLQASGRNHTPDHLKKMEQHLLFSCCDDALIQVVEYLHPRVIVGVGNFAYERALCILPSLSYIPQIGKVTHPSPANPQANHGWEVHLEQTLLALDVILS